MFHQSHQHSGRVAHELLICNRFQHVGTCVLITHLLYKHLTLDYHRDAPTMLLRSTSGTRFAE